MPPAQPFSVSPGVTPTGAAPTDLQCYATPAELQALFGLTVQEAQIRFAQGLINAYCGRRSLLPEEYTRVITLPPDRQESRLPDLPVIQLLELQGQYTYGRRDRRALNTLQGDYTAVLAAFGSPPRPMVIPLDQVQIELATGHFWLPTGMFLVPYGKVTVRYLAGFLEMPYQIKLALAEIINTICQKGVSDRTRYAVGRVQREYASDTFITAQAAQLLAPYVTRTYA